MPDDVVVESIDSDGLWVRQRGVRLPLAELSDGYRTTAALIMDIVRQTYRCFGQILVEEEGARSAIRILHEGVVFIDEVDLHLHISWQKRIGFWLKRHFPNIQFIVTTHSPFVCQAADPQGLIRLPAPGEDRPVEHVSEDLYNTVVNGSLDDAVLTELFGLETPYSEETERLRETVAQLEARLQAGEATGGGTRTFDQLRSQTCPRPCRPRSSRRCASWPPRYEAAPAAASQPRGAHLPAGAYRRRAPARDPRPRPHGSGVCRQPRPSARSEPPSGGWRAASNAACTARTARAPPSSTSGPRPTYPDRAFDWLNYLLACTPLQQQLQARPLPPR